MSEIEIQKVAVSVKNVYFSYSKSLILNGINLSVPKATIYGLLGSSGCGKTTLLRCTLGRLKPKSGEIVIFGGKPGSKVCQIPGAGVGYMPQELGLYHDFTIAETLTYFGRIFAMNKNEINDQIEALIKLLQLPKKNKLIGISLFHLLL
jgi:ABC-type multidrug transport system ATPase subunit